MLNLLVFSSFFALSPAQASGQPYAFGGSCGSQGGWTELALQQSEIIRNAIQNLESMEDCKGLSHALGALDRGRQSLRAPESNSDEERQTEALPSEIAALRGTLATAPSGWQGDIVDLLVGKTLQAAGSGGLILKRTQTAAKEGLNMMTEVMGVLPRYQQCLVGNDMGLQLLGGVIKMSAAFAGGNNGVSAQFGQAVGNLVSMVTNSKFASGMRTLNQNQFWMSMSCLIETTAQNYCATNDAYELVKLDREWERAAELHKNNPGFESPLEGYYLMVREVPRIAKWIQEVQFGFVPKLTTDAERKNSVWDTVNTAIKKGNTLQSLYHESVANMRTATDLPSKKNYLFQLLSDLVAIAGDGPRDNGNVNFYANAVLPTFLPFWLIGMEAIPPECSVSLTGGFIAKWDDWMLNGGNYRPQFEDPERLAQVIGIQLDNLIDRAMKNASSYFMEWMVIDLANLVAKSLTDQVLSVYESLQNVEDYLGRFEGRLQASIRAGAKGAETDALMLPAVVETRSRVNAVLTTYAELRKKLVAPDGTLLEPDNKKILDEYKNVIAVAYDQFNIVLQRDTYLGNKLRTFVSYEYSTRIRERYSMTGVQEAVFLASGRELFELLTKVNQLNPAQVEMDLSSAQVVNKRNLEAIQTVFTDSLIPMMAELQMIVQGKNPNDHDLNNDSTRRLLWDDGIWSWVRRLVPVVDMGWTVAKYFSHQDRYPINWWPFTGNQDRGMDDPHGSFQQFLSRICIQSMAFENADVFKPYCSGAVLTNRNQELAAQEKLSVRYDDYMEDDKRREPEKMVGRICALRDYIRYNQVHFLKKNFRKR